jgi:disulfide bond formation protein DsbB
MPEPHVVVDRTSRLHTLIFLVCAALLGFGLYLQHWQGLDPCPWCVVQRLGYILVGLVALVAALHRPGPIGSVVYSTFGVIASVAGAAAATYHVYLQSDPERAAKCVGSPVERVLDQLDVGSMIPPLLQYSGPCTLKPWSLVGLSIPEWSLVWFVLLAAAFIAIPFVANRG